MLYNIHNYLFKKAKGQINPLIYTYYIIYHCTEVKYEI